MSYFSIKYWTLLIYLLGSVSLVLTLISSAASVWRKSVINYGSVRFHTEYGIWRTCFQDIDSRETICQGTQHIASSGIYAMQALSILVILCYATAVILCIWKHRVCAVRTVRVVLSIGSVCALALIATYIESVRPSLTFAIPSHSYVIQQGDEEGLPMYLAGLSVGIATLAVSLFPPRVDVAEESLHLLSSPTLVSLV